MPAVWCPLAAAMLVAITPLIQPGVWVVAGEATRHGLARRTVVVLRSHGRRVTSVSLDIFRSPLAVRASQIRGSS